MATQKIKISELRNLVRETINEEKKKRKPINESKNKKPINKSNNKKIGLNEFKSLVKKIINEESGTGFDIGNIDLQGTQILGDNIKDYSHNIQLEWPSSDPNYTLYILRDPGNMTPMNEMVAVITKRDGRIIKILQTARNIDNLINMLNQSFNMHIPEKRNNHNDEDDVDDYGDDFENFF
jgi:hypothetical protein